MQRGTNRLLMLLVSAAIAGCASQTERSSSGSGAQDAVEYERVGGTTNVVTQEELERRAAAKAAAADPVTTNTPPQDAQAAAEPETQHEPVQYIDRPLEEAAPAAAAATAATAATAASQAPTPAPSRNAADDALPDFPITKYEIEDEPQGQAAAAAGADEVEDLGEQPDDAVTTTNAEEDGVAGERTIGEPTEVPDEPEQTAAAEERTEVEDLGTQPDESGTVSHPEDSRAQSGSGISAPTTYPDEPVQQAAASPSSVSVNFEAEPLFNFNKANIRNDQRKALDQFVAGLKGVEYSEITAVGHADRLGTESYNQALSERRASAVRDYLVSKGVPANKIRVEGKGESEPVTGDACNSGKRSVVISCLQPDRRVDVTVNGSKKN